MRSSIAADELATGRRETPQDARDQATQAMCWSEDFDELVLGARFSSIERTVGEAEVIGFCALSGDWHPQHSDPAWAARSAFGGQIAHGMLVLSLAVGLVPFDPERVVALRRVQDVVFKRPVRLGDRIRVEGQLASLQPLDEGAGIVSFKWLVRNQVDRVVCRATVQLLWRRGAGPAASQQEARSQRGSSFWHDPVLADAAGAQFIPVPL